MPRQGLKVVKQQLDQKLIQLQFISYLRRCFVGSVRV